MDIFIDRIAFQTTFTTPAVSLLVIVLYALEAEIVMQRKKMLQKSCKLTKNFLK